MRFVFSDVATLENTSLLRWPHVRGVWLTSDNCHCRHRICFSMNYQTVIHAVADKPVAMQTRVRMDSSSLFWDAPSIQSKGGGLEGGGNGSPRPGGGG